jgi:Fe-S cluster biogenesis protein NfuA/nitrite reductase/ring-hydroxylating ferredoxin subunit
MNIFSQDDLNGVQEVIKKTNGQSNYLSKKGEPLKDEVSELNRQSDHIQELIEKIETLPDPKARKLMEECIQEILGFYGRGLEKILQIISNGNSSAAKDIYNDLIEDSFINGLLLIHDLHPLDLKTRLYKALEKVKPYMDSHGGSVEIVRLENGIAKLKLAGNCKGCPSSASTLELGIRQGIEEYCPDLLGLEVEGVTEIPDVKKGGAKENSGWKVVSGLSKLPNGKMMAVESGNIPLIVSRVNNKLYAYRNLCPACDRPFTNGTLNENTLACQLGHRFDVQHAGLCTDDAEIHLEPFPLLEENGIVKLAVG